MKSISKNWRSYEKLHLLLESKKVNSGSDLMLRSENGTRTIRFDLINSHGDKPHINVQTWQQTIRGWSETTPNIHIYPK